MSYFGGVRKGKRGRGAAGKVPVFGILKRIGRVYTKMIPDAKMMKAIKSKVLPDSVVYTDNFGSYNALDVSEFKHRRVNHSKTFVGLGGHHINGIGTSGTRQARASQIQWNPAQKLLPVPQGMRVPIRSYGSPKQQFTAQIKKWANL